MITSMDSFEILCAIRDLSEATRPADLEAETNDALVVALTALRSRNPDQIGLAKRRLTKVIRMRRAA